MTDSEGKKRKYPIKKDGEWIRPKMSSYKMECCDCGLVHSFDFIVVDEDTFEPLNGSRIIFRAYRINKRK